jgi:hypothetical protein
LVGWLVSLWMGWLVGWSVAWWVSWMYIKWSVGRSVG